MRRFICLFLLLLTLCACGNTTKDDPDFDNLVPPQNENIEYSPSPDDKDKYSDLTFTDCSQSKHDVSVAFDLNSKMYLHVKEWNRYYELPMFKSKSPSYRQRFNISLREDFGVIVQPQQTDARNVLYSNTLGIVVFNRNGDQPIYYETELNEEICVLNVYVNCVDAENFFVFLFYENYMDLTKAYGCDCLVLRSEDGGVTWKKIESQNTPVGYSVHDRPVIAEFLTLDIGIVCYRAWAADGNIYITKDRGVTWNVLDNLPYPEPWRSPVHIFKEATAIEFIDGQYILSIRGDTMSGDKESIKFSSSDLEIWSVIENSDTMAVDTINSSLPQ